MPEITPVCGSRPKPGGKELAGEVKAQSKWYGAVPFVAVMVVV